MIRARFEGRWSAVPFLETVSKRYHTKQLPYNFRFSPVRVDTTSTTIVFSSSLTSSSIVGAICRNRCAVVLFGCDEPASLSREANIAIPSGVRTTAGLSGKATLPRIFVVVPETYEGESIEEGDRVRDKQPFK